ncbi:hypothetical protein ACVIRM_005444 [Rhizobium laguerreae]
MAQPCQGRDATSSIGPRRAMDDRPSVSSVSGVAWQPRFTCGGKNSDVPLQSVFVDRHPAVVGVVRQAIALFLRAGHHAELGVRHDFRRDRAMGLARSGQTSCPVGESGEFSRPAFQQRRAFHLAPSFRIRQRCSKNLRVCAGGSPTILSALGLRRSVAWDRPIIRHSHAGQFAPHGGAVAHQYDAIIHPGRSEGIQIIITHHTKAREKTTRFCNKTATCTVTPRYEPNKRSVVRKINL